MSLSLILPSHEPYQTLLDSAETWHNQGHYKEAVIIAQTGLELFTEKMLGYLYRARGVEYLKPQFENLLINYNIGNTKVSGLYIALSNDPIRQESFWAPLIEHVELRNKLVHDGEDATEVQARSSLNAVKALIDHVIEHNGLRR